MRTSAPHRRWQRQDSTLVETPENRTLSGIYLIFNEEMREIGKRKDDIRYLPWSRTKASVVGPNFVGDPWHFGADPNPDPDPPIRTSDQLIRIRLQLRIRPTPFFIDFKDAKRDAIFQSAQHLYEKREGSGSILLTNGFVSGGPKTLSRKNKFKRVPGRAPKYIFKFYRNPSCCRCYYCRKELDGWEPNDDPW
jgi:hypothetical protein